MTIAQEIGERFFKLYPDEDPLEILKLQDSQECDLDPDYIAGDVFDFDNIVRVILSNEVKPFVAERDYSLNKRRASQSFSQINIPKKRILNNSNHSRSYGSNDSIWKSEEPRRSTPLSNELYRSVGENDRSVRDVSINADSSADLSLPPPQDDSVHHDPTKLKSPSASLAKINSPGSKRITSGMLVVPEPQLKEAEEKTLQEQEINEKLSQRIIPVKKQPVTQQEEEEEEEDEEDNESEVSEDQSEEEESEEEKDETPSQVEGKPKLASEISPAQAAPVEHIKPITSNRPSPPLPNKENIKSVASFSSDEEENETVDEPQYKKEDILKIFQNGKVPASVRKTLAQYNSTKQSAATGKRSVRSAALKANEKLASTFSKVISDSLISEPKKTIALAVNGQENTGVQEEEDDTEEESLVRIDSDISKEPAEPEVKDTIEPNGNADEEKSDDDDEVEQINAGDLDPREDFRKSATLEAKPTASVAPKTLPVPSLKLPVPAKTTQSAAKHSPSKQLGRFKPMAPRPTTSVKPSAETSAIEKGKDVEMKDADVESESEESGSSDESDEASEQEEAKTSAMLKSTQPTAAAATSVKPQVESSDESSGSEDSESESESESDEPAPASTQQSKPEPIKEGSESSEESSSEESESEEEEEKEKEKEKEKEEGRPHIQVKASQPVPVKPNPTGIEAGNSESSEESSSEETESEESESEKEEEGKKQESKSSQLNLKSTADNKAPVKTATVTSLKSNESVAVSNPTPTPQTASKVDAKITLSQQKKPSAGSVPSDIPQSLLRNGAKETVPVSPPPQKIVSLGLPKIRTSSGLQELTLPTLLTIDDVPGLKEIDALLLDDNVPISQKDSLFAERKRVVKNAKARVLRAQRRSDTSGINVTVSSSAVNSPSPSLSSSPEPEVTMSEPAKSEFEEWPDGLTLQDVPELVNLIKKYNDPKSSQALKNACIAEKKRFINNAKKRIQRKSKKVGTGADNVIIVSPSESPQPATQPTVIDIPTPIPTPTPTPQPAQTEKSALPPLSQLKEDKARTAREKFEASRKELEAKKAAAQEALRLRNLKASEAKKAEAAKAQPITSKDSKTAPIQRSQPVKKASDDSSSDSDSGSDSDSDGDDESSEDEDEEEEEEEEIPVGKKPRIVNTPRSTSQPPNDLRKMIASNKLEAVSASQPNTPVSKVTESGGDSPVKSSLLKGSQNSRLSLSSLSDLASRGVPDVLDSLTPTSERNKKLPLKQTAVSKLQDISDSSSEDEDIEDTSDSSDSSSASDSSDDSSSDEDLKGSQKFLNAKAAKNLIGGAAKSSRVSSAFKDFLKDAKRK